MRRTILNDKQEKTIIKALKKQLTVLLKIKHKVVLTYSASGYNRFTLCNSCSLSNVIMRTPRNDAWRIWLAVLQGFANIILDGETPIAKT